MDSFAISSREFTGISRSCAFEGSGMTRFFGFEGGGFYRIWRLFSLSFIAANRSVCRLYSVDRCGFGHLHRFFSVSPMPWRSINRGFKYL